MSEEKRKITANLPLDVYKELLDQKFIIKEELGITSWGAVISQLWKDKEKYRKEAFYLKMKNIRNENENKRNLRNSLRQKSSQPMIVMGTQQPVSNGQLMLNPPPAPPIECYGENEVIPEIEVKIDQKVRDALQDEILTIYENGKKVKPSQLAKQFKTINSKGRESLKSYQKRVEKRRKHPIRYNQKPLENTITQEERFKKPKTS